jgi:hypothetical protein
LSGRRELHVALVVAALGASAPARADEPVGVVVIGPSEQEPLVARVEQELRALGFVVTFSSTTSAESSDIARVSHASAVLRVATAPPQIRVWIAAQKRADPGGLEVEAGARDFKIDAPTDKSDPAVVALGAVELLHGALLPVDAKPVAAPPLAPPPPAPPVDVANAPRQAERGPFAFQIGGGAAIAPGGVPGAPVIFAGASLEPWRGLEVALWTLLPTAPGTVMTEEGSIHVHVGGGGADVGASLRDIGGRLDVHGALGAGLMVTAVDGDARAGGGAASASASSVSFFPHARVAGAVRLVPWLSARADVLAGLLTPEPVVQSLARPVARVGQPELAFIASLEARP